MSSDEKSQLENEYLDNKAFGSRAHVGHDAGPIGYHGKAYQ